MCNQVARKVVGLIRTSLDLFFIRSNDSEVVEGKIQWLELNLTALGLYSTEFGPFDQNLMANLFLHVLDVISKWF